MKPIVAVAQLNQTTNTDENYRKIANCALQASQKGAVLLCLPENCLYFGPNAFQAAISLPTGLSRYQQLAKDCNLWLSLGGVQELCEESPSKYHNSHLLLNNQGDIVSNYHKLHLFDVSLSAGQVYAESNSVQAGSAPPTVVESPIGKVGVSICYDLRFPELYRSLSSQGAEVLLVPAAFLERTGAAHWEALLRARAIENQCYVVAAAMEGRHSETRTSYGHSAVVDPWGTVVAMAGEGEKVLYAEVDLDYLREVRRQLPCLQHRRRDLF